LEPITAIPTTPIFAWDSATMTPSLAPVGRLPGYLLSVIDYRGRMSAPRIVVMGVSGSGKSTVGVALATRLGVPFVDGDDLHPDANKAKMAGGTPLEDADRWPWLALVGEALALSSTGLVLACSALKRSYRDAIRAKAPDTRFAYLRVPRAELAERIVQRPGHFMPVSLLDSQLATLEEPTEDEKAIVVAADESVEEAASAISRSL
jgi:carbohydrate kinase (thermoresistant glucokinase family)